jgi:hypothetical protein
MSRKLFRVMLFTWRNKNVSFVLIVKIANISVSPNLSPK